MLELLTDGERQSIILSFLASREDGASETEVASVLNYWQDCRLNQHLLELILNGKLLPTLDENGEFGVEVNEGN